MIRNQRYIVLESNEFGSRPVDVTRLGAKMVFWRDQAGKVKAVVDRCPHRGVTLSDGKSLVPVPGTKVSEARYLYILPSCPYIILNYLRQGRENFGI
ncbi:MAG: Rieske 2Fe-2S domain-containing protein [Anaerolineaceae bacterium]